MIEWLWETNERIADYSFNRSHAACYALIAYRTAWLKANYPAEYMAALISSVMDTKDKVPFFVNQAESMGIEILPPDVNESDHEFVVVDGNIRFGLDAVKGVGYAAVEAIKAAREDGGPFTSLWDFCERVDCRTVNKKSIEALIKCGAFGSTGREPPQGHARRAGVRPGRGPEGPAGRADRPGLDLRPRRLRRRPPRAVHGAGPPADPAEEFDRPQLLAMEKESIGLFITEHPLKRVREALRGEGRHRAAPRCPERRDGDWVKVGGMLAACKKIKTRTGTTVMFATLDDLDGQVELLVFEKVILAAEAILQPDQIVMVRGTRGQGGERQGLREGRRRRALRPLRGRDRAREGAGGRARRRPRAAAAAPAGRRRPACPPP